MEFKQSTFEEIIESETIMILTGKERYGAYYINAFEFIRLLGEFVKSVDADRFVFTMFLSQIKKHSTLALFSTLRLHHIQAMMDLRQVLEAGSSAAYAIANLDSKDFADFDKNGYLDAPKNLAEKRYAWLDKNYPVGSRAIHNMKKGISSSTAHSNIIYAHKNFGYTKDEENFEIPFFDKEDEYHIKTSLWMIGNIVMGLMDLFYGVSKNYGGIVFSDDFIVRLKTLEVENQRLKTEMMETERYKKTTEKNK